jgi:hypothetical protein
MTMNIGGGGDVGNGDGGGDKVVTFPTTAEERRALRKAKQDRERQRLVNVFIDEAGGDQALFRAPDNIAYADLIIAGHRETWPVRSLQFRHAYVRYLRQQLDRYLDTEPMMALVAKAAMSKAAVNAALDDFETRAICSSVVREVYVRVAEHNSDIYIDMTNADWHAIRVTPAGWSVVEAPPVRFVRTAGTMPLPMPTRGTKIDALRPLLNTTDTDFPLVVAFLLAALYPRGPYPILILYGVQGSGRTNFLKRLRMLIDPHTVQTSALPSSGRDLFIMARNTHFLTFENLPKLSDLMSDHFCRLATGSGYRQRRLFKDADETLFRSTRPIACEGIVNVVTRPDLQDRSLIMKSEALPEYIAERELLVAFEQQRPGILGALLDMMATGLAQLPVTKLVRPPRMADFATWAVACGVDRFEEHYASNRANAIQTMLAFDPLAEAIRALMARRKVWRGVMRDLLNIVGPTAGFKDANKLSSALRRLIPPLATDGIKVIFEDRKAEHRPFRIERAAS